MSEVTKGLASIIDSIPIKKVTLVAISKTKPNELIMEAYEAGHRDFGENKAQEMRDKYEALPKDIRWHMVGHLQRNKVKYIAPYVHLIHSLDSVRLLKAVNKEAGKNDRIIEGLLQVHIAKESSKFGFDEEEISELLASEVFSELKNVRIKGLMGMATNTEDTDQIKREFNDLKELFDQHATEQNWDTLSMGMSGDYSIAIECGSTMIRVGSAIFGERSYG